jgi:hypothetical protein
MSVLEPKNPTQEAKKRDVQPIRTNQTGVDGAPTPMTEPKPSQLLPTLEANTVNEDSLNHPLITGSDEEGDPLPAMPTNDLVSPDSTLENAEGDLFNPSFPVPVNIDYNPFNAPNADWDQNPLEVIKASQDALKKELAKQKEWTDGKIIESIFKDDIPSPSANWYPEAYYDLKETNSSADEFFNAYTTNQFAGLTQSVPPITGKVGEDHITTATQNAIQARGGPASIIGQEIQSQQQGKEPLGFFQGSWEGYQAWMQLPGIAVRTLGAIANMWGDAFAGRSIDRREGILTEENKKEISEALAYLSAPESTDPRKPTPKPKLDLAKGEFGAYGRGSMGLANYIFNIPQQVLNSFIYDVADVATHRYSGNNPLNKQSRLFDALNGDDLGFGNVNTERRYLSPVTDPNNPYQWAAGIVLDLVTGNITDNIVTGLTKSVRVANQTAKQTAARAPNFAAKAGSAGGKKITATQAQEWIQKAQRAANKVNVSPASRQVARKTAEQAAEVLRKTPKDELAKVISKAVMPEGMAGKSPPALAQTTKLVDIQASYTRAAKKSQDLQDQLKQSLKRLMRRTEQLEAAPNLERSPIVSQLQSKQVLGGMDDLDLSIQPKPVVDPAVKSPKPPRNKAARDGLNTKFVVGRTFYHGTKLDIEDLSRINPVDGSAPNELGAGVYFTTKPDVATQFALAHPQVNKPHVPTARYFENGSGMVHEVGLDTRRALNANVKPDETVRKVFVDSVKQFLDPKLTRSYIAKTSNAALDKYWTAFRETWAELNPRMIPEDKMLAFQRSVAAGIQGLGYDSIIKQTADDVIVNVLKTEGPLPIETLSKVAVGTGDMLEQKAARLSVDRWADELFGSATSSTNRLQSHLSLEAENAERLQSAYLKAEQRASELAEELADADDKLIDIVTDENRTITNRTVDRGRVEPVEDLKRRGYAQETDKPCL